MTQDDFIVVILAGGKGSRLHPYTRKIPKGLMKIDNITILERSIEIVKNQLKKREVHLVLGYGADEIMSYLANRRELGVEIIYHRIPIEDVKRGLTHSLLQLRTFVKKYFVVMMGDEVYVESDHEKMIEQMKERDGFDIFCMIKETNYPDEILKNYSVEISGNGITSIEEKPEKIVNKYAGLGTIACSLKVLDLIDSELKRPDPRNFIDCLGQGVRDGLSAYYFLSHCDYFNINNKHDLFLARYFHRSKYMDKCKKSLIIPAYNEAETIGSVVRDFKDHVDEIVVMDNQSPDGTGEIARKAGAKVFSRKLKGYGDAIRQGLDEAEGDILIITEADMTFRAKDLSKLLEYLKDADAVIGTRTSRSFIHDEANMDWLLRIGNVLFGKMISMLWWDHQCRLTDVGCTYRVLWRSTYDEIRERLVSNGPEFSPEMLNSYLRLVEVPVNYHQRVTGQSKISISKWHSIMVALRMLSCILSKRIQRWIRNLFVIPKVYK